MFRRTLAATVAATAALAALAGCGDDNDKDAGGRDPGASRVAGAGTTGEEALADNAESHAAADDGDVDESEAVDITLADGASSVADDAQGVQVDGDVVTISAAGTYRLSGKLTDGQVVVDSPDEGQVVLVLDGVDLTSASASPLVVDEADEAVVVLAEGSQNHLSDSTASSASADSSADSSADDEESDAPDATLFSRADLTIAGEGSLSVEGLAAGAIASEDGLVVGGGQLTVKAADDGIRGKDYLRVEGGSLAVTAGGDGLRADNDEDEAAGYVALTGGSVVIDAKGDGVAATTDSIVTGGTLQVTAGGGSGATVAEDDSAKAVKAGVLTVVSGGALTLNAAEDGLHSESVVSVTDGTLQVAVGDDAVHAEEDLTVSDGTLTVSTAVEGLEAAKMTLAGGTIDVRSSDDAINVSGDTEDRWLSVTGGDIHVNAEGDGIDVNGSWTMTGGTVLVDGPTVAMEGALDVDDGLTIDGGTLVAAGSAGMPVAPVEESEQGFVSVRLDATAAAGEQVSIVDGDGEVVVSHTLAKEAGALVVSDDAIVDGEEYVVQVGGEEVATVTAGEGAGGGPGGDGPGGGGPGGGGPGGGGPGGGGPGGDGRGGTPPEGSDGERPAPPEGSEGQRRG